MIDLEAAPALVPFSDSEPSSCEGSVASTPCLTFEGRESWKDDDLRVLIYTTCYNVIDGVTVTIRKLEQAILSSGGSVCILTTKSGNSDNTNIVGSHPNRHVIFLDNSVELPAFVSNDSLSSYHLGFSISKAIEAEVDEFRPSIIHVTCPDLAALHVIHYARTRQLPLMGTYHSNIPDYMLFTPGMLWLKPILEGIFKHIYNFLQALYVPTPFIRKNLIDQQKFDRITNIQVWGRGVDLDTFSPRFRSTNFREKLNVADDVPVILFVGRLVQEKRPDIFAAVVRRLHSMNVSFHAIVVGAGPCDVIVKDLPNTTCLGWLSGDKLSEAYASSDIFLFPSSVETFGNVTLEAAASGLPLVVESGCSGHLVRDSVNGYACIAGKEDDFFEATLRLILDPRRREMFSQESVKLSESMEQKAVSKKMVENYTAITEEFFVKYHGLHENRDEEYQNSDSFRGGTDPRPFGMSLIEFFFVHVFFRLLTFLVSISQSLIAMIKSRTIFKTSKKVKRDEVVTDVEDPDVGRENELIPLKSDVVGSQTSVNEIERNGAVVGGSMSCSIVSVIISIGESRVAVLFAIACLNIVLLFWRSTCYLKKFVTRTRSKLVDCDWKRIRQKSGDGEVKRSLEGTHSSSPEYNSKLPLKQRIGHRT